MVFSQVLQHQQQILMVFHQYILVIKHLQILLFQPLLKLYNKNLLKQRKLIFLLLLSYEFLLLQE